MQQYIELIGDIIAAANQTMSQTADLLASIAKVQKNALLVVNEYVDNEKNCFLQHADKVERTEQYDKNKKLLQELERCNDELQKIQIFLQAYV